MHSCSADMPRTYDARARCGFCAQAKQLFVRLAVTPRIVELDERGDGHHMQGLLADMTGQRTVPNIWVNGKHVGGCDATMAEYSSGELQKRLGKL